MNADPHSAHNHTDLDAEEKKALRRVLIQARVGVAILGGILLGHFFGFY